MKREELVGIALKITALFIIIILLSDGFELLAALKYMGDSSGMPSIQIAYLATLFAGAILLFMFSHHVARVILPSNHQKELEWSLTLEGFEAVCFSVLGMYVLVNVIPEGLRILFIMNMQSQYSQPGLEWNIPRKADMASLIAQLILGPYLLLGGRGLSRILNKFRNFGLVK